MAAFTRSRGDIDFHWLPLSITVIGIIIDAGGIQYLKSGGQISVILKGDLLYPDH
jgi:hypothetical protein